MCTARRKKNVLIDHFIDKAIRFIDGAIAIVKLHAGSGQHKNVRGTDHPIRRRWTGNIVELVELVYGLEEMKCIDGGEVTILELATELSVFYGVEIKDCYSSYVDMKRRKNNSRTYFLDKMAARLNSRMLQDDERESQRS